MNITLKRVDGVNFVAQSESGHEIMLDGSDAIGGQNLGARPMEVVLAGLGGCSAIDVMTILRKSRQHVLDCEIEISAERVDSIPGIFSKIHLHYRLSGVDLNDKKVNRAISLSMEKYCSVTRMLEKSAKISFDYQIIQ